MTRQVKKKTGLVENWDSKKIAKAITKAADRVGVTVPAKVMKQLLTEVESRVTEEICVKDLHTVVEQVLIDNEATSKVGNTYASYRNYKQDFAELMQDLHKKAKSAINYGDKENANFESSLVSTQQSLVRGYLTKELYKLNYLTQSEREAIEEGYIYIHDIRDLIFNNFNCCLFDMGAVLKGGFEMANLHYTEPTSVLSALQLIGDATLVASAQQLR